MTASDNALSFEAVKVSMNQTKDGIKITLVIHPNDIPPSLFSDPVGSRYQVAMVAVDDNDQPIERHHAGNEAVRAAGALCRNPKFQQWLTDIGMTLDSSEETAVTALHHYCGIRSRAELATNANAKDIFDDLRVRYSKAISEEIT